MDTSSKSSKRIAVAVGCVYRTAPEPKNAIGVRNTPYEFLLAKRIDDFLPELDGKWELPGGRVESGETPQACVKRELLEETGYRVRVTRQLERAYTYVRVYPDLRQYTTVTCYQCELASPDRQPTEPDSKIGEVGWFNPDEIDFRRMLQGSREFLVDVAKSLDVQISAQIEKTTYLLVLQVLRADVPDAETRLGRSFAMSIQFSVESNEYLLVTSRGGRKLFGMHPKLQVFSNYGTMLREARKTIRARHYHGYAVTKYDDDFPLVEWMRRRGFPFDTIGDKSDSIHGIQLAMPLD